MTPSDKFFPATAMPDPDWWAALWPDPVDVLQKVGLKNHMTAVDLCCGDGYFTEHMSRMLAGRVYGIDLHRDMIKLAKKRVEDAGAPPCHWIQGDAREIVELVAENVDYVLIANTFHGIPDKITMARNVAAILKPGGLFAVVNWHPLPREKTTVLNHPRGPKTEMRISPQTTRELVRKAGFEFVETVELPPYHYGAIFKKTS